MTASHESGRLGSNMARTALLAAGSLAALVLLLLYLEGSFGSKVAPGIVPLPAQKADTPKTAAAEEREVDDWVEWPATVTSRSVAELAPKTMARVLEVRVAVGTPVRKGDVVAVLDDRDMRARAQQAEAALRAAQAQASQAEADLKRAETLFRKQAVTPQDLDAAETRAKAARAQVAQANDAVAEARVMLGETTLLAPFDGVIAARLADPGDMAVPGKPLAVMHDPSSLRLEAHVSERCAAPLAPGTTIAASLDAPEIQQRVRVEEIAPAADPHSRTVLIKASFPEAASVRPGMFATLRLACGKHAAILVPAAAVKRAGQLESVRVVVDGEPRLRSIRTGQTQGDLVEVLSGLQAGDVVVVEP